MSLQFIEGFDNVTVGTLAAKGWTFPGGGTPTAMGAGRTGANAVILTASGGTERSIAKQVAAAGEHATFIAGMAIQRASTNSYDLMRFKSDSGATSHVIVQVSSTGAIIVKRGDGTTLGTSAAVVAVSTWGYLEVKAVLHDSTGSVVVKYNGATILNLTALDTKNGGAKTVFDSLQIGTGSGSGASDLMVDDVYLCNGAGASNNDFLGDCKVQTIVPSGDGNASQMVGSDGNSVNNYALVNSTAPQTATYVGSPTTDNEDTYAFGDIPGGSTVLGVQVCAYATKTDAGARSVGLVTRRSGTDYTSPDLALPTGSQTMVQQVMDTDPSTSAAWTAAGVNAAEFGARARP